MPNLQKKICLMGMYGVGKTSLVRRFVENVFDEKYHSTIGVKVDRKRVALSGQQTPSHVDLLVWDIAGQDDSPNLAQSYFRGAHGGLLVHDLTRPESLQHLVSYRERFAKAAPQAKIIVVGNKADLVDAKNLEAAKFQELLGPVAAVHLLTSAKTGENVEKAFQLLAEAIFE